MALLLIKIKTLAKFGINDILAVFWYRVRVKSGLHRACKITGDIPLGPFFYESSSPHEELPSVSTWIGKATLFGYIKIPLKGLPPRWLANPITGDSFSVPLKPWWKISDFDEMTGDIKLIWEQSRMDWVVAFAQRARNGDKESLEKLNAWIADWLTNNPPYLGPNWKCGQEASIRVIHLCCAAMILGQERETLPDLRSLIRLHLQRIEPTLGYAIAQNNNHGTSEAAALFIGGSWLTALGALDGVKYEKLGRKWLEDRASKLIAKDGSFSQYSLNYHRMVLDTFSIVEVWLRKLSIQGLHPKFYKSAFRATSWLYQMVCPKSGDGPNLGANDGSLLLQFTDSSYSDFRPSVQLASALFQNRRAYSQLLFCDLHLAWLGIDNENSKSEEYVNCDFDSGGFKILRSSDAKVIFRYPKFSFRPSQADAMHIDLWVNGINFLGDAGSYSYNSVPDMSAYFSGTGSHNTVQFDDRDQMPRLGRFLFGSWLKTKYVSPVSVYNGYSSCSASYCDYQGAEHSRRVNLSDTNLSISDNVKGFREKAVIRWRLSDSKCNLELIENGVKVENGLCVIVVTSNTSVVRADIVQGWVSMFYMKKQSIPVLEVEISGAGIITTDVRWQL